jgi:hypothetical protein
VLGNDLALPPIHLAPAGHRPLPLALQFARRDAFFSGDQQEMRAGRVIDTKDVTRSCIDA